MAGSDDCQYRKCTEQYETTVIVLSAESADELTKMTRAVLGESDISDDNKSNSGELTNSLFTGGTEKHKNPWNIHCTYEDTLNLSGFLKDPRSKMVFTTS